MGKQVIDFVNPSNLIWCRKKAGFDIPAVYKRACWTVATGKIESWENGSDFPTISELKKLGKVYKKAWTLFLLKENLSDLGFMVMKDYRGSIDVANEKERRELIAFANEIESRQNTMLEFSDVLDIKPNTLFGSLIDVRDSEIVVQTICKHIKIDFEEFWRQQTRRKALNFLQESLGRHNILVSFSSLNPKKQVSINTMRGMLLRSVSVPIIGINSAEKSIGAQIFTIFHELAHLLVEPVNEGEVYIEKINFRDTKTKSPKEKLCDQVAASILVPTSVLKTLEGKIITANVVEEYCKRLKINVEPFLYRASQYGLLDEAGVDRLLKQVRDGDDTDQKISVDGKKQAPDGGLLHLLKNGKTFPKFIRTLYSEGVMSYTQALSVLDVKASTFNRYVSK